MGLLDELTAQLEEKSPQEQAELARLASTLTERWIPTPGPQTEAYFSPADELLYGGEPGGGKSDLILGLAFNSHKRTAIFRREYGMLGKMLERVVTINGSKQGFSGASPAKMRHSGGLIDFFAAKDLGDEQKFQGNDHDLLCVGRGTPVLMGDKSYRQVESLQVGDMVMTMEGPRCLQRVLPVQLKPCVKAVARSASGYILASQIQSTTHPLLTEDGWFSAAGQSEACVPTAHENADSKQTMCASKYSSGLRLLLRSALSILHKAVSLLGLLGHRICLGNSACAEPLAMGATAAVSCGSHQDAQPRPLSCVLREHLLPFFRLFEPLQERAFSWSGDCGVRALSLLQDYRSRYSAYFRPCDERTQKFLGRATAVAGAQQCLLLSSDVGLSSPKSSPKGALGETQKCIGLGRRYTHPYTKEIRQVDASLRLQTASLEFTYVGMQEVFDLQIDEVNHYITEGGFINQNCFDEATQFSWSQITFLHGWVRSDDPKQKCRVVYATNPPLSADGMWVHEQFAPWINDNFPEPAEPGELRWVVTDDSGKIIWVDGPTPIEMHGRIMHPKSRTFIRAGLSDNPYYGEDYLKQLDSMDHNIRAILMGGFGTTFRDQDWQLIPTAWVKAAQARWLPRPPSGIPMCTISIDPGGGGMDKVVMASRYDGYFPKLKSLEGKEAPTGEVQAAELIQLRRDGAIIVIDLGGGYGMDVRATLRGNLGPENWDKIKGHKGAEGSNARTADGAFAFKNKRSEVYWRFKEALNPSQSGGSPIALDPNDHELVSDLTAPTYGYNTKNEIEVEKKEDVMKKLGRSPGRSDAVVMCWSAGPTYLTDGLGWAKSAEHGGTGLSRAPRVNTGRSFRTGPQR